MKNTNYTVEGNKLYDNGLPGFPSRVYTIVDNPPVGFEIWNVGKHTPDGYTLYCRCDGNRHIYGEIFAVKN